MQKKVFFLACLFICIDCFAQQYPFVQYTPKDGLVNSRVRKIYQDSKGRMYFITFGGLSIYDGARFSNYTRQEGLPFDLVNDVLEISPDSVLIATNTSKLNVLVNGKIFDYPLAGNGSPLINRFLKCSDGKIYAAGDDGLFVLAANKFIRLPVTNKQGKDIGIYFDDIVEWGDYFLLSSWGNVREQIILYDRRKQTTADLYTDADVSGIKPAPDGNIWIGTSAGIKTIVGDSATKGKLIVKELPDIYSTAKNYNGQLILFDRSGNAWIYNSNVIHVISPKGDDQIISQKNGLKAGYILDLFQDRERIMWIATDGNGIIKMRGTNIQAMNTLPGNNPLSRTALEQANDTIWLYNAADNTICRLHNNVLKKFPFQSGGIYVTGTKLYVVRTRAIFMIADNNDPASYRKPKVVVSELPETSQFGSAVADPYGALIVMKTTVAGYFLCVYKEGKLVYEHPISFMTDKMLLDLHQRLWIATRNDHVAVFTLHPNDPTAYLRLQYDYAKQLPAMNPRTFVIDRDGNAWIGTRYNGIYKIEFSADKVVSTKQFTTHEGLTDNFIYSMACDHNNNVWAGTQSGLDKIFLRDGKYIISNVSKNNNFFQTIYYTVITTDNTVWAGTGEGNILKIDQASSFTPGTPPPLLLNLTEVNNTRYDRADASFSHRFNNFSFTVAAPSFIDEKSILYSYQLLGTGNSNWSTPANNSNFNFSNLSPGHYTLNAKAQFPESIYPPQSASYSFTILPPWWQTLLFRLLASSFIMVVLIMGTRFYYRRKMEKQKIVLEKQQAIEKERTRIATDMHDDLGAGLSRIKFLSETIGIKKQQQQPIEEEITKIREYSHEMIDKMGEIVWALNEKNDSLSDLLSYTRSYAVEYLSQNGILCTVSLPDQLSSAFVSGEFRRNVFLAVKEILHNVVKHSQANMVNMDIGVNHELIIRVQDDGTGFERNNVRPFSNGLTNIEKRMKDIGGGVEINSANGTAVKLKIPL